MMEFPLRSLVGLFNRINQILILKSLRKAYDYLQNSRTQGSESFETFGIKLLKMEVCLKI